MEDKRIMSNEERQSVSQWQRLLPILFFLLGAGLMVVAVGADFVGIGSPTSFGPIQVILTLVGFIVLLGGVGLAMPVGQRYIRDWHMMLSSVYEKPTQSLPEQPVDYLYLAIWFGLVIGLGEVALIAVQKFFLHRIVGFSLHVVWMAPVANLFLFAMLGLILFFVAQRWPRKVSLRIAAFVFSFLGFSSLLFTYGPLHKLAALLLAVGLAVQTARLIAAHAHLYYTLVFHPMAWIRIPNEDREQNDPPENHSVANKDFLLSRRQFLFSAGATLAGLTLGTQGWQELREQRALAKLPPALPSAPNVLLIVLDTVRAQNLSLYGYDRPTTPQLERLAKGGVRFERAISTAPWTLPSHASLFTGRWHHELSVDWTAPLDATYPTLAEVLSANGYLTAGFVANLVYCSREMGLNRGFAHYEDYPVSPGQLVLSSSLGRTIANSDRLRNTVGYRELLNRKNAAKVNRDFLRWLSYQEHRPFFAFLNYFDAHQPYLPPHPFDTMFGPKRPRGNFIYETNDASRAARWQMSPQEVQVELDAYDGAIAYLDHHLGLLFDELEKRGVLQHTLVIITADHGEQFGEHGLFGHSNSLYLPALHVPLLILFPAHVPAGRHIAEPVSLRNLPATVIDLLGLKDRAGIPGDSLVRYWRGINGTSQPAADIILSEINSNGFSAQEWYPIIKGDIKSLVFGTYHYIKNGDGHDELYDFLNDSLEMDNLADSEEARQVLMRFRSSLEAISEHNQRSD